jgi:MFS family permease
VTSHLDEGDPVKRHLLRNSVAQVLHGVFGQTGFRLVEAPTFLPAFLFGLSGSDLVVGVARSLQGLGTVISPVIGASLIGHRPRILSVALGTHALMRLQILGMALAGFFLGTEATVMAFITLMTLMGFFQGMSQVTVHSLRAKVIPVNRRGIVSGARNFFAGIASASVAYAAGAYFIDNNVLGNGYSSIFLLAFIIATLGLGALAITKEPSATSLRPQESPLGTLSRILPLLREDRAFKRFFIARALGSFGRGALPFYILFAGTRMEVTGEMLGLVTTVWMLTSSSGNIFWGAIADRKGYRVILIATLALWTASHVYILFAETLSDLITFFVIMGVASGGFNQAGQNMVLEFGRPEDLSLRIAASGTAVNVIASVGPFLGGLVVVTWSYLSLFMLTAVLQLAALLVIVLWVPEPRSFKH